MLGKIPVKIVCLNWLTWSDGFPVTTPRLYEDVGAKSFFSCTARFSNSLLADCFPLTYDPNCFKSRGDRLILYFCSFFVSFPVYFSLDSFLLIQSGDTLFYFTFLL